MASFVDRIEHAGFFARPRQAAIICNVRSTSTTKYGAKLIQLQDNTDLSRGIVFSSCRASAAGSCLVPDDTIWTGDACICATMNNYNVVFSKCIHDTPYSSCIDPSKSYCHRLEVTHVIDAQFRQWKNHGCMVIGPLQSDNNASVT